MSLNSAMVYRRTDRGLREVYEKSHQFTQSERLVLILLDGRLTVANLRARLPSLDNERIERTIVKLEEAGLVEPMNAADDLESSNRAEEVMRLEPEIVAHFLEQNALDPVTATGTTSDEVAAELVRASVDRAAAQLAEETAGELPQRRPSSLDSLPPDSGRSHFSVGAFDDERAWDSTEASSFAITTVNVPDRLDLQEERDRADMEEYTEQRRRVGLQTWMKRLLVVAVVVVFGGVLYGVLKPLRDNASAAHVGERMSCRVQASGQGGRHRVPVHAVASVDPARSRRRWRIRRRADRPADQLEGPVVRAEWRPVDLGRGDGRPRPHVGGAGHRHAQGAAERSARLAEDDFNHPLRVDPGRRIALVFGAV